MIARGKEDWLPQFIVIGAVKAATTWIQTQLQANPGVYLPDPEPHFFSQTFEEGLGSYRKFFADAPPGVIVGEKSADYLAHDKAAQRIAGLLPDVRLVVQLRDPAIRAYSDYKMFYRRGWVKGKPEEYLTSLDNPHPRFLHDGLYGQHLRHWLDYFPREALLVFLFEDVVNDPRTVIEEVSRHIGAEPFHDAQLASRKQNNSKERILPLPIRTALAPLKQAARPLRGNPVFEFVRGKFAREIEYPLLDPTLEQRLRDFYRRDVEVVEELLGRDLGKWKGGSRANTRENLSKRDAALPEGLVDLS